MYTPLFAGYSKYYKMVYLIKTHVKIELLKLKDSLKSEVWNIWCQYSDVIKSEDLDSVGWCRSVHTKNTFELSGM